MGVGFRGGHAGWWGCGCRDEKVTGQETEGRTREGEEGWGLKSWLWSWWIVYTPLPEDVNWWGQGQGQGEGGG